MTDITETTDPTIEITEATPTEQLTLPYTFSVHLEEGHEVGVTVSRRENNPMLLNIDLSGAISVTRVSEWGIPTDKNTTVGKLTATALRLAQEDRAKLPKDVAGNPLVRGDVVQCLWHKNAPHYAHIWSWTGSQFQLDSGIKVRPDQVRKVDLNALSEALATCEGYQLFRVHLCYEVTEKPPGCRTRKSSSYVGIHALYVPIVGEQDAPVAFIQHIAPDSRYPDLKPHSREWRWSKGKLYTCEMMNGENPDSNYQWRHTGIQSYEMPPGLIAYERIERTGYAEYCNDEFVRRLCMGVDSGQRERIEALEDWAKNAIIINGQLWQVAVEPHIYICYDHQENSIGVGTHYGYVKDGDMGSYCNLLEIETAIAAKQQTILAKFAQRGIGKEVPTVDRSCTYEVLIPEAVQLRPRADYEAHLTHIFNMNLDSCRNHVRSKFNDLNERHRALELLLAEVQGELLEIANQATAQDVQATVP